MAANRDGEIRAAGGVVVRDGRVLLVHRPKYDDWTLPKGKAEPDETDEECALREVLEETGYRCRLGVELASTSYRDRYGRPKVVRYWWMEVTEGAFTPNGEVDEVTWLAATDAKRKLSYERDAAVVDAAISAENPRPV